MESGYRQTKGTSQGSYCSSKRSHRSWAEHVVTQFWVAGAFTPSEAQGCSRRPSLLVSATAGPPGALCPCWGRNLPSLCDEHVIIKPVALPSAPSVGVWHPADESHSCFGLSRSLFPLPHNWGDLLGWGPPAPQLLGSCTGKGRFSHLMNLDLICK